MHHTKNKLHYQNLHTNNHHNTYNQSSFSFNSAFLPFNSYQSIPPDIPFDNYASV